MNKNEQYRPYFAYSVPTFCSFLPAIYLIICHLNHLQRQCKRLQTPVNAGVVAFLRLIKMNTALPLIFKSSNRLTNVKNQCFFCLKSHQYANTKTKNYAVLRIFYAVISKQSYGSKYARQMVKCNPCKDPVNDYANE
ncbi:hypothetical protein LVJ82_10100 [Vitreoscilla massiliensis]|uniref:Uncharacterized protein n=1 Tax=Vitreoscilla massiliensis TaxID=1689272 RepID=A0ABY4DY06_9NEIS|nr:hypothetical protein [Vitreoscilla massiliensis]UOO87844.1 hypothetical protein LVJ82_10100 [Vitreoscilla massiliensis]